MYTFVLETLSCSDCNDKIYAVVLTSMYREHSAIRALIYRISTTSHDTL